MSNILSPSLAIATPAKGKRGTDIQLDSQDFYHDSPPEEGGASSQEDTSFKASPSESTRSKTIAARQRKRQKTNRIIETEEEKEEVEDDYEDGEKQEENYSQKGRPFKRKIYDSSPSPDDYEFSEEEEIYEGYKDSDPFELIILKLVEDERLKAQRQGLNKVKRFANTASSQVRSFLDAWIEGIRYKYHTITHILVHFNYWIPGVNGTCELLESDGSTRTKEVIESIISFKTEIETAKDHIVRQMKTIKKGEYLSNTPSNYRVSSFF